MKYTLIVVFVLCCTHAAIAQKHNVFADVSILKVPGGSLTYNYKLTPRFGMGIGAQGNKLSYSQTPVRGLVAAAFADMRFYFRPEKKNRFFSFVDLGMSFRKDSTVFYNNAVYDIGGNGFYLGTGFGYFRPVTKRGWGPYVTLKLSTTNTTARTYYYVEQQEDKRLEFDGYLDLAIGFKF